MDDEKIAERELANQAQERVDNLFANFDRAGRIVVPLCIPVVIFAVVMLIRTSGGT